MPVGGTGLVVHRSARVEALLDPLVARLRDGRPADPFVPVHVVVQSQGMQRWLSHQLAQRIDPDGRGVLANVRFPFPAVLVDRVVAACGGATDERDPWVADRLVWPLAELLADLDRRPELAPLARYLERDTTAGRAPDGIVDRRTWRLARSVADVFDRYALHRPAMAAAWARGEHRGPDGRPLEDRHLWQPLLWAELTGRLGDPTRRLEAAIDRLRNPSAAVDEGALPSGVTVFGLSTLPGRHLELLAALATRVPVALHLPTPSPRRWAVVAAAGTGEPAPPEHPLLVSCGQLGDDAARLVLGLASTDDDRDATSGDDADPVARPDLLRALQASLRADRLPRPGAAESARHRMEPRPGADRSVQLHRCHGPSRQAEVLRDVVLGLLADDPSLEPRDVVVLTPDVERFAPLVQTAFASDGQRPELPVRVADRHVGRTDPLVDALLAILELAGGRATASEVLDVLGRTPVAARFDLSDDDLGRLATWVSDTGIRWGVDEEHRAAHGQPADRAHTWRAGLDRLLLGVAMPDEDHRLVGDTVPYDHVEGDDVELAGRFAAAVTALFDVLEQLRRARPAEGWRRALELALDRCLAVGPDERWRLVELRTTLRDVVTGSTTGGAAPSEVALDLGAVTTLVESTLARPRRAAGYETGAVTLCELVPMRSIPYEVVCLLGLDDGAFPRQPQRLGFDLTERHHLPGDRDRRQEDRFLFLEALLAARRHLVVTCTGRDLRTNEAVPPAVPVAELLDVLDRVATTGDPDLPVRDVVTTDHPLHPFSPRAFGDDGGGGSSPPVSFDVAQLPVAEAARHGTRRRRAFVDDGLPEPGPDGDGTDGLDEHEAVRLDDLVAAVGHPVRFLLERRLRLHLREHVVAIDDHEPLELDGLTRHRLGDELLRTAPDAGPPDGWLAAVLATGTVPAGTPGRLQLSEVAGEVDQLRREAGRRLADAGFLAAPDDPLEPGEEVRIDVSVGPRRLEAVIGGVVLRPRAPDAPSGYRVGLAYVRPRPRHLLRLWVEHLALAAAGVADLTSWQVLRRGSARDASPKHHVLVPLDDDPQAARDRAVGILEQLLAVHDAALRGPVPLFEHASSTYARTGRLDAAADAFASGFSEDDVDDYVEQAHGPDVGLDDVLHDASVRAAFVETAATVWAPALDHERASKDALKAHARRRRDGTGEP